VCVCARARVFRCSALVLSVNHLVLLTKNICRLSVTLDWVVQLLADVEDNLTVKWLHSVKIIVFDCYYSPPCKSPDVDLGL